MRGTTGVYKTAEKVIAISIHVPHAGHDQTG